MLTTDPKTEYDVAVVGSGIAGLTSAALLASSQLKTVLLESHDKPGGCAGYFRAGDFTFPVGATAVLGLEEGGLHRQVFDRLSWPCPPALELPGLQLHLAGTPVFMAKDQRTWRRERRKLAGNHRAQEIFWKLQEAVADEAWHLLGKKPALPILSLRDALQNMPLLAPGLVTTGMALVPTCGEILKLLGLGANSDFLSLVRLQLLITTQGEPDQTPFLNAAAGLDLWRHGAFHPMGGAGALAEALLAAFTARSGTLLLNSRVQAVRAETHRRRSDPMFTLQTPHGTIRAKRVVFNLPRENLTKFFPLSEHAARGIRRQVRRGGPQWGAFNLYCAVRDEAFSSQALLHHQILTSKSWSPGQGKDLFMSISAPGDLSQAPEGWRAVNISTHTHLAEWANLDAMAYREKKKAWRNTLLIGAAQVFPDLEGRAKFVIAGTPRTWEKFTERRGVGGYPLSRGNANLMSNPVAVESGIYVVGDTTFPGQGTVACALSGWNAWRRILAEA